MLNLFTAINEPDIDIILNSCIMGKIPFVLVEGMDDISKYHTIFSNSEHYSDVLYIEAIENIKDYSLGCEEIERCIDELYLNHPQQHDKIDKYIISIIDKDIRDIKNNIPNKNTYIILKEYSIESIFVSKKSIEIILKFLIKGPDNIVTESIVDNIFNEISINLVNELYYCSLDALNFSLNSTHKKMRYKFEYGFIENNLVDFHHQLSLDNNYKNDLDGLASTYGINQTLSSLIMFVKGKWIYRAFIKNVLSKSKELQDKCKNSAIQTCCYCKLQKYDQCLYKNILTQGFDHIDNHVFKSLPKDVDFGGFDYLVDEFNLRMNSICS